MWCSPNKNSVLMANTTRVGTSAMANTTGAKGSTSTGNATRKKKAARKKKGPIERLHPRAEKIRAWFFSPCVSAYFAWGCIIALAIAILVWFFVFSSFGAPAQPVYEGF